jgi:amino acid transporter
MSSTSIDKITAAGGGGGGLFLRRSTGLVRAISPLDGFLLNTVGLNVGIGALFLLLQAQSFFPSGNMVIASLIGTLLMGFTIVWVYSEFASAMPRSGGDYVFTSRVLNPFLGFLLGWNQAFWLIFFWIGFNAWFVFTFAIPTSLQVLSAATGNSGLASLATTISQPVWVFLLGTVLNVFFAFLVLTRRYFAWQRISMLFAVGSLVLIAILLLVNGSQLPARWDAFVAKAGGIKYAQILPAASAAGYQSPTNGGFDLGATLLMLPWVFFVVGFGATPAQLGGEIKRASRSMWVAIFGAVVASGLALTLIAWIATQVLGTQWLGALGAVPGDKLALPVQPGINFIGSLLAGGNVILLVIIGLGFIAWAINGTPASELQATRYMLAGALDRMIPGALGDVDERMHSPVKAIVVCTLGGELAILALSFIPQASLLGALLSQMIAFIIVSIAGVLFPYRMPAVWQSAGARRIFGLPLITVTGAASAVVLTVMLVMFVANPSINGVFGVTHTISLIASTAVVVAGAIWYFVATRMNRSRGIDSALLYKSIPPE